jgi:hypothetical protein
MMDWCQNQNILIFEVIPILHHEYFSDVPNTIS